MRVRRRVRADMLGEHRLRRSHLDGLHGVLPGRLRRRLHRCVHRHRREQLDLLVPLPPLGPREGKGLRLRGGLLAADEARREVGVHGDRREQRDGGAAGRRLLLARPRGRRSRAERAREAPLLLVPPMPGAGRLRNLLGVGSALEILVGVRPAVVVPPRLRAFVGRDDVHRGQHPALRRGGLARGRRAALVARHRLHAAVGPAHEHPGARVARGPEVEEHRWAALLSALPRVRLGGRPAEQGLLAGRALAAPTLADEVPLVVLLLVALPAEAAVERGAIV
mmetsp:Transcript_20555/g.58227  ORF Transcript_20555/g.58227 Transcript_20555/m.58227 type:complete len:280 (+) Transcript_20555:225-1064(+)